MMNITGVDLPSLTWLLGTGAVIIFLIYLAPGIKKEMPRVKNLKMKKGDTEVSIEKDSAAEAIPPTPNEPEQTPPSEREEEKPETKGTLDLEGAEEKDELAQLTMELSVAVRARDGQTVTRLLARLEELDVDRVEKIRLTALAYSLQYRFGDTVGLPKLQALVQKHEGGSPDALAYVYTYLGDAYTQAESYNYAMKAYEQAALLVQEPKKANLLVSVAQAIYLSGQKEQAVDRLMAEVTAADSPSAKSILFNGLAWVYQQDNNLVLRAVALEKALECDPGDFELHFNSAWSYGELDLHELPLVHYRTYIQFDSKSHNALNNIGVEYDRLGLPIHAVSNYTAASDLGNTLATANLAQQYIDAGFVEDAKRILNKAKQVEDAHPNVGRALSVIGTSEEAEDKTEEGFLKAGREQQRFLLAFADAYFTKTAALAAFSGLWQRGEDEDDQATIADREGRLVIEWEEGSREHHIDAKVANRGAVITSYRIKSSYTTDKGADVGYMYLSPDGKKLFLLAMKNDYSVYTKARSTESSYMILTRIE